MQPSITFSSPNLNTGARPPGRKLTIHFSIDKKVICQADCRLTANTRFIEIPLTILQHLNACQKAVINPYRGK